MKDFSMRENKFNEFLGDFFLFGDKKIRKNLKQCLFYDVVF